jgi:hypothetical protein
MRQSLRRERHGLRSAHTASSPGPVFGNVSWSALMKSSGGFPAFGGAGDAWDTAHAIGHVLACAHDGLTCETSAISHPSLSGRSRREVLAGSNIEAEPAIRCVLLAHRAAQRRALHAQQGYGRRDGRALPKVRSAYFDAAAQPSIASRLLCALSVAAAAISAGEAENGRRQGQPSYKAGEAQ